MQLYLEAKSANQINYTPDWIQLSYEDEGKTYELTLDVRGDISAPRYEDNKTIHCRVKGDLVPWVLTDEEGNEANFNEFTFDIIKQCFPESRILELFKKSTILVGFYPLPNLDSTLQDMLELVGKDIISDGKGKVEFFINGEVQSYGFNFNAEVNL